MDKKALSYKDSGVDISRTDRMKLDMAEVLKTSNSRVMNSLGAFASLYDFADFADVEHPVLVLKAEEPGSKQKMAFEYGYEKSICHDMINHLVNDIIVMGAKPLAVLDVIISGGINEKITTMMVKEMAAACENNSCSLVGGETSIQPGILGADLCVLSSSIAGVVDKNKIIDGSNIQENDVVIYLASNGLHTNGYTLIRKMIEIDYKVIDKKIQDGETFIEAVMKPHTAYYPILKNFMEPTKNHGMAHITGGGIEGNLCRIIPEHLSAVIDLKKIELLPIFKFIHDFGNITDKDMLSTFNCGVGLIMVVNKEYKEEILQGINPSIPCFEVGTIKKKQQGGKIEFVNQLEW